MANEVITDEMLKAAFGRGKVPTGSSFSDLIDYIKQRQGGNGLQQVDLTTYAGTVGEIVQHVGPTYKGPDNTNTLGGYVHGHIYEYMPAVVENWNLPSDSMVIRDGYAFKYEDYKGVYTAFPDPDNNPQYFDTFKEDYQFPWVYTRPHTLYRWHGRSNYSHFHIYTKSNTPQVGDNVILFQGVEQGDSHWSAFSMGEVKSVEPNADWKRTALEIQWYNSSTGEYVTAWYGSQGNWDSPRGSEVTATHCAVFTTANNEELILVMPSGYFSGSVSRSKVSTQIAVIRDNGDIEWAYGSDSMGGYSNIAYDFINTGLYTPLNIPAHWERLIQMPSMASVVIPLRSGTTIAGWNGGQYEPVDVENIVDYYTENVDSMMVNPNIVAIENAGISVNGEPLYVRTMTQGQSFITTIPYGHSAIFTKASDESNYYPATTTITITEYELAELAQGGSSGSGSSGSGGYDSYGGDYSEDY